MFLQWLLQLHPSRLLALAEKPKAEVVCLDKRVKSRQSVLPTAARDHTENKPPQLCHQKPKILDLHAEIQLLLSPSVGKLKEITSTDPGTYRNSIPNYCTACACGSPRTCVRGGAGADWGQG